MWNMIGSAPGIALAIGIFAAVVLGYVVWWLTSQSLNGLQTVDSHIASIEEIGSDTGRGNLVAVQPWIEQTDYANAETLFAKLDGYFAAAQNRGWLSRKSIVVLPEYIGTWLAAADEPAAVYKTARIQPAMTMIAIAHLGPFLRWYISASDVPDRAKWALFTVKSDKMAHDYQNVFGALARKYGVTIVAGSIVLPEPYLVNGLLQVRTGGTLYNVSALFGPDGHIMSPLVVKSYPILDEKVFAGSGSAKDIPVFATQAGRLAVLICADSWYEPPYRRIAEQHAALLVIPSYSETDRSWADKWKGYDGAPAPCDVDLADIGKISLGQAWIKYSMGGRAAAAGIHAGVNVFLRGRLWDLGSDGQTIYFMNGEVARVADRPGAVLLNQWL